MENRTLSHAAMLIALRAHHGVINEHDGEPYILHVARVAQACEDAGLSDKHVAVAWLHDAIEDTDESSLFNVTPDYLTRVFPDHPDLVSAVMRLSKPKDGSLTLKEYYDGLVNCDLAARVKIRDIHDNFSRNHHIQDEAKKVRMAHKYSLGLDILREYR